MQKGAEKSFWSCSLTFRPYNKTLVVIPYRMNLNTGENRDVQIPLRVKCFHPTETQKSAPFTLWPRPTRSSISWTSLEPPFCSDACVFNFDTFLKAETVQKRVSVTSWLAKTSMRDNKLIHRVVATVFLKGWRTLKTWPNRSHLHSETYTC